MDKFIACLKFYEDYRKNVSMESGSLADYLAEVDGFASLQEEIEAAAAMRRVLRKTTIMATTHYAVLGYELIALNKADAEMIFKDVPKKDIGEKAFLATILTEEEMNELNEKFN